MTETKTVESDKLISAVALKRRVIDLMFDEYAKFAKLCHKKFDELYHKKFDKLCHKVYSGKSNSEDYLSGDSNVSCGSCGSGLNVYYCEERLYLVECRKCKKRALVEATSKANAAYKTFAHAVDEKR